MKNMINTIGKKMHTLVKKNTPRCHKIRQVPVCGFTQKVAFYYISLCFLPHCCVHVHIGREVRLMLPNTYQEIYDTHTCLNVSKTCQNLCLYILDALKSWWNFITLLGKYMQQKKVGWEVIFSELGFAGSRAWKPQREFKGSALEIFFHVFLSLNGFFIV